MTVFEDWKLFWRAVWCT